MTLSGDQRRRLQVAFLRAFPDRGALAQLLSVHLDAKLEASVSPVLHVTADDAPTLLIHGDKDALVPIQQAEVFVAKLKDAGVEAQLVVKKGSDHGWLGVEKDIATLADWFDKHLKKK